MKWTPSPAPTSSGAVGTVGYRERLLKISTHRENTMLQHTNTLEKLHVLESLYQQGYQNALVDQALNKILDLEREKAQDDLKDLEQHLQRFETQYHFSSEECYTRFHQGELGDEGDYFEWSAYYDMYQSVCKRLQILTGKQR